MSIDSLFMNQNKEVVVFDLEVAAEQKTEGEGFRRVLYYLANSNQDGFQQGYPMLAELLRVQGLLEAHKTIRSILKKIDNQNMNRTMGGLTLRVRTEEGDDLAIKRSYSNSKNFNVRSSLQK